MTLRLAKNPDILADVAAMPHRPFTIGFAAETDRLKEYAGDKLETKGIDMIAANLVGTANGRRLGFESEDNALLVLWPGGSQSLPSMPKGLLAGELIDLVCERYLASAAT